MKGLHTHTCKLSNIFISMTLLGFIHNLSSSSRSSCHAFTSPLRQRRFISSSQINYRAKEMDLDAVDLKSMTFADDITNDNEPVILLHGLLGQKRNFASLGNSLMAQLKKKRQIFAVDLRNHGENHDDWRDEMSYSHMADDVLAFLDKHEIEKAILCGHSMGGKVAKSLALSNPDRVAGLVVLDIAPVTYTSEDASWNAVEGIIQSLRDVELPPGKTKRDVDFELRTSVEDPALRAFVLTNLDNLPSKDKVITLRWKINVEAIAEELHKIAGFDVGSVDLQEDSASDLQYEGDTFLIKGGASSFVKNSHMPVIKKHFPNFLLTSIKGAGHWVHAESPDQTVALLKQYLDR